MFLLIHLYFGAAGQMTPRSGHGNGSAGPLRALASYHPIASTLHQTLLLNLVAPVTFTRSTGTGADEAPWEAATLPDPTAPFDVIGPAATLARTPVHAVLLQPAADGVTVVDAIVTWGRDSRLQRAAWETGGVVATSPVILADPFLCRRTNREGAVFAVRADATRAAWRDLDALLLALPDVGAVDLRPRVLAELDDDSLDGAVDDICVEALGIDQDGRSKNTAMMASRTRPVPPMLRARHPRAADAAATSLQRAGTSARRLDIALERVWLREGEGTDGRPANKAVKDQDLSTGWRRDAQQQYWAAAEELFWSHVHLAAIIEAHATLDPDAPEPPGPDPAADYRSLARTIYDRVTAPLATRLPYTRSVARNRP
ncbi:MAG: type I-E CRISPR-associated protein Cse1/CasA [Kineosporiaceae bacterium]|nr:type I-E CRISPR-associated protein Cse1/CasA [Kineosporiaceae bacterium]